MKESFELHMAANFFTLCSHDYHEPLAILERKLCELYFMNFIKILPYGTSNATSSSFMFPHFDSLMWSYRKFVLLSNP